MGIMSGCGFFAQDEDEESSVAQIESVYEVGKPVAAVGFEQSQAITLSVLKGEGEEAAFEQVEDGEYLAPGQYTMGVTVTPRTTAKGKTLSERVFLGDGGWDYNVEAIYDQEKQMYVAQFKLIDANYFLITPILVQVIYSDGKASKAKFLVTTAKDLAAPAGSLVDRGMSVTVSKAFLGTMPDIVNPIIAEQMGTSAIEINNMTPANNSAGKDQEGVVNIDVAGITCDIVLEDRKVSSSGEITRGLYIGIEDVAGGTMSNGLEMLTGVFANLFLRGLSITGIPTMALGLGLGDMVEGMMSSSEGLSIPGLNLPPVDLGLSLESTLYLNLLGYPSETTSEFAVLGGAMYVPDNADVSQDENGYYVWPAVSDDTYDTMMDVGMGNIMTSATDIGVGISQYNINQMLAGLMKNLKVTVKDINQMAALFGPKVKGDAVDLEVTINPKGIAADFTTQRIVVNDVKLLLVENGEVNGAVAELSLDLSMEFDVEFRLEEDTLIMELSVTPMEDRCHMHVMKDETGLDALDHGKFVPIIFQYLAGGQSTLTIPLPLSDFGILPRSGVTPGTLSTDDYGNCFLSMATSGIDMDKISALTSGSAGCFIETAAR
jgi:hypothetical protein